MGKSQLASPHSRLDRHFKVTSAVYSVGQVVTVLVKKHLWRTVPPVTSGGTVLGNGRYGRFQTQYDIVISWRTRWSSIAGAGDTRKVK